MTRILRDAADVRDQLERARWIEDMRLAERQAAACLALIGAHAPSPPDAGLSRQISAGRGARASLERR